MLETHLSRMLDGRRNTLCVMMLLSERVKEAIDAAADNGHTVAQIAKACGIKPQAVYQWMDGATKSIDGENLVELAELSGYLAMWIVKERGPKSDTRSMQQAVKLIRQMTPEKQAIAVKIIAPLVEQDGDNAKVG